jgi:hypothetical protein
MMPSKKNESLAEHKSKVYLFCEPHVTGGNSLVSITDRQIIDYMKRLNDPRYNNISDEDIILDFISVHWAWEKTDL